MKVGLYSDYPFRHRADGGPRDDFERAALARLRANPTEPVASFEERDGATVLRYATARVLKPACVKCHNEHPDSTKTDWKEGEVRGVLEIVRPLDRDEGRIHKGLRGTVALVAGIGATLLGLSVLLLFLGNRRPGWPTLPEGAAESHAEPTARAVAHALTETPAVSRSEEPEASRMKESMMNQDEVAEPAAPVPVAGPRSERSAGRPPVGGCQVVFGDGRVGDLPYTAAFDADRAAAAEAMDDGDGATDAA